MRKVLLMLLLVPLVLAVLAAPAAAEIPALQVDSVNCPTDTQCRIAGTIRCTPGETFIVKATFELVNGTLIQGRANGTCTGDAGQVWQTGRNTRVQGPLATGPCEARAIARDSTGDQSRFKSETCTFITG